VTAAIVLASIAFFALFPRFVVTTIAGRAFAAAAPFALPYVYAVGALSLAYVTATYAIARGRMRFVVPLTCVAVGEVVSIVVRHGSVWDFLQTIVVGHTLALAACLTSLGGRTSRGAAMARRTE
jgi:hypothetical protein